MTDYKIEVDLHCHTIKSKNSYSTVLENISVAKKKNLKGIAVTDYGPKEKYYQLVEELETLSSYIPKEIDGIKIYKGIECNVLNILQGNIDIKENEFPKFDWVIASYHKISDFDKSIINTSSINRLYTELANNPLCMTIGHMERFDFPFDIKNIVTLMKKNAKVIEVNNLSIKQSGSNYVKMKEILLECIEQESPICIVSNAHIAEDIGNFEVAFQLLNEIDFPERLIINSDINLFNNYIENFKKLADVKIEKSKGPRHLYERAKK